MSAAAQPRVSVVIPHYNGERHINDAIDSVQAQTYRDFEIIVVDDGSTDDSREALSALEAKSNVTLLYHEHNRGIAAARNSGVRSARGEFIAFLDQDDLWQPEKLAKQIELMDLDSERHVGLVFTARRILGRGEPIRLASDDRFPQPVRAASRREVLRAFMRANFVWFISVLVRAEVFEEVGFLDESIRSGADDYDFCVRVALRYQFDYVPEELVLRREHGDNFSDAARLLQDDLAILQRITEHEPGLKPLLSSRHAQLLFRCGRALHGKGERSSAQSWYSQSLAVQNNFPAAVGFALCKLGPLGDILYRAWSSLRRRLKLGIQ